MIPRHPPPPPPPPPICSKLTSVIGVTCFNFPYYCVIAVLIYKHFLVSVTSCV